MKKGLTNMFIKGMNQDALPSMQPEGTYRYMLNGKMESLDNDSFGVVNEGATELCFSLPENYELVGGGYVRERDVIILFSTDQSGNSEIGIGDIRQCKYTTLVNDANFPTNEKLQFTNNEWIKPQIKRLQPCNEIVVYWSNNDTYRRINIDDTSCKYSSSADFELFKCICGPTIETRVSKSGGQGLLVGAYQAVVQLEDNDGNTTNWFFIDYPVYLTSEKNAEGDISDQSIEIIINDIDIEYDYVNIGIVSTIDNQTTAKFITKQPRKPDGITYNYVGQTTEEIDIDIEEIFTKNPGYLKGRDLVQKDGRLILYNLLGEFNLDYQWKANEIFTNYKILRVPAKEAHLYPNLQRDEVYRLGIVWHFCDGSSSPVFHIPGRTPTQEDLEKVSPESELNCSDCKEESRWRVQNTARQTELFCSNVIDESQNSFQTPLHTPAQQVVVKVLSDNANNQLPAEFYELAHTANGNECNGNCLNQEQTPNCPNGDCSGSIPNETDYRDATHVPYEPCLDCGAPPCFGEDCGGTGTCPEGVECAEASSEPVKYPGEHPQSCFKNVDLEELVGKYTIFGNLYPQCEADLYLTNVGGECVLTSTPCSNGSCQAIDGSTLSCSSSGTVPVCRSQVITEAKQGGIGYAYDAVSAAGDCIPEPIYDEDGCIVGYQPVVYSKGDLAYWHSLDTYPVNLNCDGSFLYGNLAGAPIRDHKMPNIQLEPHFISYQNGVPHHDNYDNQETKDGYVHLLTLDFCNIKRPDKLPKPLCKERPFSIVFAKRDDYNKSVIASGLFTGTFQGDIFGRSYAVPKNGVNSLEYFDRYIQSKDSTEDAYMEETHGGYNGQYPIYNFHSPETNFKQPRLSVDKASIEFEYFGTGWMYGWVAKGRKQESVDGIQMNNKGMRQSIHLNHYKYPLKDKEITIRNPNNPCCDYLKLNMSQESFREGQCDDNTGVGGLVFGWDYDISIDIDNSKVQSLEVGVNAQNVEIWEDYQQGDPEDCLYGPLGRNLPNISVTKNTVSPADYGVFPRDFIYLQISGGGNVYGALTATYTILLTTTEGCRYSGEITLTTELTENGSTSTYSEILESSDCDYITTGQDEEGLVTRCIKGISYTDADSVLEKGTEFSLPLLNLKREQSVTVEFTEPDLLRLDKAIEDTAKDLDRYNGTLGGDLSTNGTSDGSFIGDLAIHERPIYNAAGWYGTLKYDNKRQYGRLEALRYQRLYDGTEEALLCGNINGIGGDTWIGPYSIRRTSYISDKVGHHPVPPEEVSRDGWGLVANALGLDSDAEAADALGHTCDCGNPPKNADLADCRNWAGLRFHRNVAPTWLGPGTVLPEEWGNPNGRKRPSCIDHNVEEWDYPGDLFYPATLKTNVTFWTESQINIWNRKAGEEELSEVAYPILGDLELDPAMPKYTSWQDTFLAKFYAELERASKFRLLVYTIICYFFAFVLPVLVIAITIGGGIISAITGSTIAVLVGRFWGSKAGSKVRRFLQQVLGFDNCLGDKYEIDRDGWVKDFAPAYHGYNWDYSKLNDLEQYLGMPDNYNTCDCLADLSQTVYYSNQQLIGSPIDAYRNFKPNNFVDIPADAGQIQNFFMRGNQFFIHTTDNIWNLYSDETTLQAENGETIYLGRGDLFQNPRPLVGGIPEGWAGTLDPNASINTPLGYVFIDREASGIFIMTDKAPIDISSKGMRNFFKEHLQFKLKQQFPDFELIDEKSQGGIGYSLAYDPRHLRVFVTKIDYEAIDPTKLKYEGKGVFRNKDKKPVFITNTKYFRNTSFTVSYDLRREAWVSFHSYVPRAYFWDRDHMYSYEKGSIWKHDSRKDEYQVFYDDYYPFIIEYTARGQQMESIEPESIILDTEASQWNENYKSYINGIPNTFNQIIAYNQNQSTGLLNIQPEDPDNENRRQALEEDPDIIRAKRADNTWRISGFEDRVKDKDTPIFKASDNLRHTDKELIDSNIENKPQQFNSSIFFDKQFNVRLIFNKLQFKTNRLITKLTALISRERQE